MGQHAVSLFNLSLAFPLGGEGRAQRESQYVHAQSEFGISRES